MGRLFDVYKRDAWGRPVDKTPDEKAAETLKQEQAKRHKPPKKKPKEKANDKCDA